MRYLHFFGRRDLPAKVQLTGQSVWLAQARSATASREWPAWLLSVALHATLLVILGLVVRVAQRGATLEPARGGGIVLARDVDGMAEYYGEEGQDADNSSTASTAAERNREALPAGPEVPVDLAGGLPAAADAATGAEFNDALPSAAGFTSGGPQSRGRLDGNPARTSIFGAEGTGSKFVYVFDRSASMDGYQGRPLAAAKAELIASLQDLDRVHQFQIIFYNDRPTVFNPFYPQPPRMLFGDSQTKRLAQNFVRGIIAAGGTRHLEALELALATSPDVVFFLTDAAEPQLSASQLAEIRRRNARVGATIHAIEFGAGPDHGNMNFLVRLARQNGGQHVYVDVTRLPLAR